jgi:hypothetical protein
MIKIQFESIDKLKVELKKWSGKETSGVTGNLMHDAVCTAQ